FGSAVHLTVNGIAASDSNEM
ncbi:hypothetical protein EVA_11480, partial [gut metagenome]